MDKRILVYKILSMWGCAGIQDLALGLFFPFASTTTYSFKIPLTWLAREKLSISVPHPV
jgi:hypothetical protein